jgi:hypothetical protein
MCWLRTASFWLRWISFDLYWPHVRFMGPSKPSSPVITLWNHPSLLRGGLLDGKWGNPRWRLGGTIIGGQDFILGAGAQFRVRRDFMSSCCTWDPRDQVYDVLVKFFPAGCTPIRVTLTLSDMSDRLSLLSSHSMFCYIGWMIQRMIIVMLSCWLLYLL